MNAPIFFAAGNAGKAELLYVWEQATPEAKVIIVCLMLFSVLAWSVMIAKAIQMRRAKRLNEYFTTEYRNQKHVLDVFASLEGVTIASEDGGLALALALVQRVLKLHGGELDVGSSGARAVFAVALPLDLDEGEG